MYTWSWDKYYFAGKYMDCVVCHGTFNSCDHRVLQQLTDGTKACFPVVRLWGCIYEWDEEQ